MRRPAFCVLTQIAGKPEGQTFDALDTKCSRHAGQISARAPATSGGETFAGWRCVGGSTFEHTSTNPPRSKGRFGSTRSRSTTFTMPADDVILRAIYAGSNR